jgi:tryptophan synthase alpha chain
VSRIDALFRELARRRRKALIPFFTAGFPSEASFLSALGIAREEGADLVEVGVPFSDPLADGPTIQRSSREALEAGITLAGVLELVARAEGPPVSILSYLNPILARGYGAFAGAARAAGAVGVIVPDLPPEESGELTRNLKREGLGLTCLVSPTSSTQRIERADRLTTGFLYLVSRLGTTGARPTLAGGVAAFVRRVQACTRRPLCLGFGISDAVSARPVVPLVDGLVVGSALIDRLIASGGEAETVRRPLAELRRALDEGGEVEGPVALVPGDVPA